MISLNQNDSLDPMKIQWKKHDVPCGTPPFKVVTFDFQGITHRQAQPAAILALQSG